MAQITIDAAARSGTASTVSPSVAPDRVAALSRRVVASPAGETIEVVSPLTGQKIAELPRSTPEDVAEAAALARKAQVAWARRTVTERAAVFLRFHDLVLAHQEELLDLIQLENGKARLHAFEEIADTATCSRHYARKAKSYLRTHRRGGALPVLTQVRECRIPKGVVGIISPWNYPLSLGITDAIPALIAGNAVLARPDVKTSLTALAAYDLLYQAGLPEGVLQVVLGAGSTVGQAVIDASDYVSYTGSTATGRRIAAGAAQRLVGYSMELGGKNSAIVRADANLYRTVPGVLRASFASSGQLCISAERIVVHKDIAHEFTRAFVQAVSEIRLGNTLDYSYDMGSLISQEQLDTVTRHVDDAVAKGAKVLVGGKARPDIGPFTYEPTVLADVTPEMACRNEETFGPVVSIYVVDSDEEAVALANDTEYGLNASVWTSSTFTGRQMGAQIRTGTVNINEGYAAAWGSMGAPMGGMKASGIGRRHGSEGIVKYTEVQNVAVQHLMPIAPSLGMSPSGFAKTLTFGLKLMKLIGMR